MSDCLAMAATLFSLLQMWNMPSRSMELWWLATITQASSLSSKCSSPSTSQPSPSKDDKGLIRAEPSLALSTEPGLRRERGIISKEARVSHK